MKFPGFTQLGKWFEASLYLSKEAGHNPKWRKLTLTQEGEGNLKRERVKTIFSKKDCRFSTEFSCLPRYHIPSISNPQMDVQILWKESGKAKNVSLHVMPKHGQDE